jgi:hypothetical protein
MVLSTQRTQRAAEKNPKPRHSDVNEQNRVFISDKLSKGRNATKKHEQEKLFVLLCGIRFLK